MKELFSKVLLAGAFLTVPAAASAQEALEGQWRNPKGSLVVRLSQCGNAYCGTVVRASERAKEGARKGGTANLIGTRILTNLRPAGKGTFKGQAFEPKRNIRAPATIRMVGPDAITVKGCAIAGMLLCKEQRWTRVS
jgi:uncharacterized protein (DUF2147 family)